MGKKIIKTWNLGYLKSRQKAKKIYSKIGRIQSPVFNNEYISFNRNGFNHLIRKGRVLRTKTEQKKRFVLLQYIEKIVKNPRALIIFREEERKIKVNRYGKKILVASKVKFWTFIEEVNFCKIKIVISQSDNKIKKFCSIMGDDVKTNSKKTKKSQK